MRREEREVRVFADGRYIWVKYRVGQHENKTLSFIFHAFIFLAVLFAGGMLQLLAGLVY